MFFLWLAVWIFCGIGAGFVATSRGSSGCLWFGLGVAFGPFGLAAAFLAGERRRCPYCMKDIHPSATKCPYCQSSVPIASQYVTSPKTSERLANSTTNAQASWNRLKTEDVQSGPVAEPSRLGLALKWGIPGLILALCGWIVSSGVLANSRMAKP